MAVCVVTGGAGFIGSHLVEALLERGHHVRVVDNFCTGDRANLAGVAADIELIEADIRDETAVTVAVDGAEVVYHQAALPSVPRSVADPITSHAACATGTLNVLQAARSSGVRRVVYAASSSAYGNSVRLPKRESDPTNPLSPYAVAKLAGEHYCKAFHEVYGLETVRLRYFNVYGPRQSPDSPYAAVIPKFLEAMLANRPPTVYGDGTQSRDFTFVADAVQANLLAAEAPSAPGNVYNVACGERTSLLELIDQINALLGTSIQPVLQPARKGDVQHSQADIERAHQDLGYVPRVLVAEGVRRCLDDFVKTRNPEWLPIAPATSRVRVL
jgi:UDP-glucose 4-epimerase